MNFFESIEDFNFIENIAYTSIFFGFRLELIIENTKKLPDRYLIVLLILTKYFPLALEPSLYGDDSYSLP